MIYYKMSQMHSRFNAQRRKHSALQTWVERQVWRRVWNCVYHPAWSRLVKEINLK